MAIKIKQKIKWLDMGSNIILRAEWGRVSYNPHTGASHIELMTTKLLNTLADLVEDESEKVKDGEETALYDGKIWRILTGDFRKEYEKAFPNLKKCIAVYDKYKDKFRNNYSTD